MSDSVLGACEEFLSDNLSLQWADTVLQNCIFKAKKLP